MIGAAKPVVGVGWIGSGEERIARLQEAATGFAPLNWQQRSSHPMMAASPVRDPGRVAT